jgi:uncharacterized repeat protein (TIGR01451 family)
MSKNRYGLLVYLALLITIRLPAQNLRHQNPRTHSTFGQIPLYFEENRGQTNQAASFLARSSNLLAFITRGGVDVSTSQGVVSMRVAHADLHSQFEMEGEAEGVTNYYLGSKAIVGLRHYSAVRVRNIRPGIDLRYYGNGLDLEYDFEVHSGADVAPLRLVYSGANKVELTENGDLILNTGGGEVRQKRPRAWQLVGDKREEVACHYVLAAGNEVRLVLGKHRLSSELLIDPILSYSTFLGGTHGDLADGIAVDAVGDTYVTGWTQSSDFPVTVGKFHGSKDIFVSELNPTGTALIYSTFIGGQSDEAGYGIAIDSSGSAYVTGFTTSSDFPFTNGHYVAGQESFVVKVGVAGTVEYSTALGGSGTETGVGIALDSLGSAYVTGSTSSSDFPVTMHSYLSTLPGNTSAFVAKLTTSGEISYATFLGGTNNDGGSGIAIDSMGDAFIGGGTSSSDFPTTTGAYSTVYKGEGDGFVAELNPDGSALIFATLLGGSFADGVSGIAVDQSGCYVTGTTFSGDFPVTPGAFSTVKPSQSQDFASGFVAKLDLTGHSLLYSTFLGGSSNDYAAGIAVDSGMAYVVGMALSANFPTTPGALRTRPAGITYYDDDIFLSQISSDGGLAYSTLFGAYGYGSTDSGLGVAVDGKGGVYLTGTTSAAQGSPYLFPTTPGAFQTQASLAQVGFVVKIDFTSPTLCTPLISPESIDLPGIGGTFSFNLTLAPGCPWEAIPDQYVNLNPPFHGLGSTSPIEMSGAVGQNNSTSAGFTGLVRIGPATFTVNQSAGSCQEPGISPSPITFDSSGGSATLTLTLPSQCTWTALSTVPWLGVISNPSGTGSATINIFADPNSFSQRSTTLTIAGTSIPVTQTGSTCTATAAGTPVSFSGSGGTGVASIITTSTCTWIAYSGVPWILMSPATANGQGPGGAGFFVAGNPGLAPRTGYILIADQTLTITQDAGPAGFVIGYTLSTFAGDNSDSPTPSGDGGPAIQAHFVNLQGLAWESATNTLFVVDGANSGTLLRAITPDGIVNTVAGGGSGTGENIPATSADLGNPYFVGTDKSSSLYISDSPYRVRKIAQGNITTFAGGDVTGFSGDGSAATSALLSNPEGLASDVNGDIYISDMFNHRVRKVSAGIITTFAGGGTRRLGDGGPATSATLVSPYGLALDQAGNLYIADPGNNLVRKVSLGTITTIAGGGNGGDGGPATRAALAEPIDVAVDLLGDVFILEGGYLRIRIVLPDGTIFTISPYGAGPHGLTTDTSGNVYYTDHGQSSTVRKLTPFSGFCAYSVAPSRVLPPVGGTFSVAVKAAPGCNWSASSLASWITIPTGASGTGNGTVSFIAAPASSIGGRSGTLMIAGQAVLLNQSGATPPVLSIAKQHSGNFFQNQQGAQYTLTVSNSPGAQPTSGAIMVTETIPSGLALVSMAGPGWTCPGTTANNCTRSDALNGGASYPAITVTVNVAANARSPKVNSAVVSGGGSPSASANDSTVISVPSPVPSVTQLSPINGTVGGAAFSLKVTGKNFRPNSVVLWGGSARSTTYVTNTMLRAAIAADDLATTGSIAVSVMTPAPGGGTSGSLSFSINNPVPVLSSLSPASVIAGNGDFTLTVNGSKFVSGAVVDWDGSDRSTTFVSSTQLTVAISGADIASAGTVPVTVKNPTPGGGLSRRESFVIDNPVPVVASLSPSSSDADVPAFALTVTGNNFVNGSTVVWKATKLATTFISGAQLTASVLASNVTSVGTDNITVINPSPGGGTSNKLPFAVNSPIPIATSLSPSSAEAGSASFTLSVRGSQFVRGANILWNGTEVATTFVSSTQVRAKIPASNISSSGMAQVTISNPPPGGGTSEIVSFTIQ